MPADRRRDSWGVIVAIGHDTPAARLQGRVNRAVNHDDAEAVLSIQALQEADIVRKTALVPTDTGVTVKDRSAVSSLAHFHLARYNALLPWQAPDELMRSAVLFRFLARIDPRLVPDHLRGLAADDFGENLARQQQAAAAQYLARFRKAGDPDLIRAALRALRFALAEFREPSPGRVVTLATRCDAMREKYAITKSADDLDSAVRAGYEARDLLDLVSPQIGAAVMCSLGTALHVRGWHNGDPADVNSAILLLSQALGVLGAGPLNPASQAARGRQHGGTGFSVELHGGLEPVLASLSSAYTARYRLNKDPGDLDRAADFARRAATRRLPAG